jgi:hypothetical protein
MAPEFHLRDERPTLPRGRQGSVWDDPVEAAQLSSGTLIAGVVATRSMRGG